MSLSYCVANCEHILYLFLVFIPFVLYLFLVFALMVNKQLYNFMLPSDLSVYYIYLLLVMH